MSDQFLPHSERLAACHWPELLPRFDAALREALAFIFDRFAPIGVVATGTIIRGTPHRTSDLDICVIHREPFRERVQRYFNGVPAEIFVNPPHTIRTYFQDEHENARSIFAHMLATGFVVWASDSTTETLRAEAKAWLAQPDGIAENWLTRSRYAAATQLEDAFDVIDSDPVAARMLLGRAVAAMIELECRKRTGRIPRGKDLISVLTTADEGLGRLVSEFFSEAPLNEQCQTAGLIADRILMARGFFEWDSGPENVEQEQGKPIDL
jgi:hypothetical protein